MEYTLYGINLKTVSKRDYINKDKKSKYITQKRKNKYFVNI